MTSEANIEAARDAALGALNALAARRDRLPEERAELVAIAWHCGYRNVAALARVAEVSRDTIYADLRERDIDPADRDQPTLPRYRPLRSEAVRQVANAVSGALSGAMLAEDPEPLVLAGWQAGIALERVATAASTNPNDRDDRAAALRDLAVRGDYVRQYAHQALAAELSREQIAAMIDDELGLAYEGQEVAVTGGTVQVYLPDDRRITVSIGTRGGTGPLAGWTVWSPTGGVTLPPATAYRHLEIAAAFSNLADLLTKAMAEADDPHPHGQESAPAPAFRPAASVRVDGKPMHADRRAARVLWLMDRSFKARQDGDLDAERDALTQARDVDAALVTETLAGIAGGTIPDIEFNPRGWNRYYLAAQERDSMHDDGGFTSR